MVYNTFSLYVIFAVAARCKNNNASDEDVGIIDELEFQDFSPFMAQYRKYRRDMPAADKTAFVNNGMDTLRNSEHMRACIDKMSDYDLEVAEIEKEIFSILSIMETIFNYIDLSFQLFPTSTDETFNLVDRHMNDLRKY